MSGTITVIQEDGFTYTRSVEIHELKDMLSEIIGGYLELIPRFNRFQDGLLIHRCVAFCDEEGKLKGRAVNDLATSLWYSQLELSVDDVLVGPVAIVYGTDDFMSKM